jgi:putative NADH-flavin reductase
MDMLSISRILGLAALIVAARQANATNGYFLEGYGTNSTAQAVLMLLRADKQLDGTFFSPAAVIGPGARSGEFRLGGGYVDHRTRWQECCLV